MRKVVLYELLSLDGVAEDPDKFVIDWDEAMDANLAAVIATQDAVILGRRSYDEWSEFWPGSEIEPFAMFINDVAKYVASSTPLGRQWHSATAIEGGLVQFVQNLKNSSGGDIGVHASISVAQALLAADAIDEVRLVVAPAIAGRGRRLLDGLPPIRLESLRSATSPRGYLLGYGGLPARRLSHLAVTRLARSSQAGHSPGRRRCLPGTQDRGPGWRVSGNRSISGRLRWEWRGGRWETRKSWRERTAARARGPGRVAVGCGTVVRWGAAGLCRAGRPAVCAAVAGVCAGRGRRGPGGRGGALGGDSGR